MAVWSVGAGRSYLLLIIAVSTTVGHDYDYDSFKEPSICDESSMGLCFTVVNEAMDWHAAEERCEEMAGDSTLASVRSAGQQEFLAEQARDAGLDEVWIGGCLKENFWHWYGHSDTLAFQGCFIDKEDNRDLVNDRTSPSITKPSQCLEACESEEFDLAGVQLSADKTTMLCHCGDDSGKHGEASDAGCNGACPGKTVPDSGNLFEARCGGVNRQLIFRVEDTTFYSWVPETQRTKGHCAYIEAAPTRRWASDVCSKSRPYICMLPDWVDENTCRSRRDHVWIAGDSCVTVQSKAATWWDAMADCSNFDSHLIALIRADIQEGLLPLLQAGQSYWIGLSFDLWDWTIWNPIQYYFNWGRNQPARGPDQDCLSMKGPSYGWYNSDCDRRLPFLCQSFFEEESTTPKADITTPINTADDVTTSTPISQTLVLGLGIGAGATLLLLIAAAIGIGLWCRRKTRNATSAGSTSPAYDQSRPLPAHPGTPRNAGRGLPRSGGRGVGNPAYYSGRDEVGLHAPPPKPKGGMKYDNADKHRSEESYAYIDDGYIHPQRGRDKSQGHSYDKLRGKGPPPPRR